MLGYLRQVIRHKLFVFLESWKLGIPWLGFIHDLSKFRPSEFLPYSRYFFGGRSPVDEEKDDPEFDKAWLYHQKANKHHWQYWILMNDNPKPRWMIQEHSMGNPPILADRGNPLLLCELENGQDDAIYTTANIILRNLCIKLNKLQPLPMPDRYRREMLADWRGAGRAYGNADTKDWYEKNRTQIILHPETREWVEQQLHIVT